MRRRRCLRSSRCRQSSFRTTSFRNDVIDMPRTLNDGSNAPPRLKVYLNLGTLVDLPADSSWPKLEGMEAMAALKAAGFEGVQGDNPELAHRAGLGCAAGGRVDNPGDAERIAREFKDRGYEAATVHVGSGFEDDAQMDALARSVIES